MSVGVRELAEALSAVVAQGCGEGMTGNFAIEVNLKDGRICNCTCRKQANVALFARAGSPPDLVYPTVRAGS